MAEGAKCQRCCCVQGMSEVTVQSAKNALELLRRAAKARQSAGTAVNERSSRSHAVITVGLLGSMFRALIRQGGGFP